MILTKSLQVDFRNQPLETAIIQSKILYEQYGCFLAQGLFDVHELEFIRVDIKKLILALFKEHGLAMEIKADEKNNFDAGLMQLARYDRQLVAQIFDACRRVLPVHIVSVDQRLQEIVRIIMNTNLISASDIKAVRIDLPNEEKYLFDWHQDYPYVMDSLDGMIFWIPLQDINETNGCLNVALGSHKLGLQKLVISDLYNKQNNKQTFMHLADKEVVNRFQKVKILCNFGDVLIFNTLLLHASGANSSNRARFTLQVRFGNFLHPMAIAKGWPGSLRDGSFFHEKHSEFVESTSLGEI